MAKTDSFIKASLHGRFTGKFQDLKTSNFHNLYPSSRFKRCSQGRYKPLGLTSLGNFLINQFYKNIKGLSQNYRLTNQTLPSIEIGNNLLQFVKTAPEYQHVC